MKIKVTHALEITIAAVGESEFGDAFLNKVAEKLDVICKTWGATSFSAKVMGRKEVSVAFHGVPLNKASDLRNDFKNTFMLLVEHGPDADLLEQLLKKHPELKNHPRLRDVVGAFENLTNVVTGVLGDTSNHTLAEISRRTIEGVEEVEADLEAQKRVSKTMEVSERANFRDLAILGQTPEQRASNVVPTEKPVVPPIYDKVLKQQQQTKSVKRERGDPEAIGDFGNVFGNAAKK